MKIYIAGPITGLSKEDYTLYFKRAEAIIRDLGFEPVNPVELCAHMPEKTTDIREYYLEGIKHLMQCDAIHLLKGWEHSRGARIERMIAAELGLDQFNFSMKLYQKEDE
jgi:hypothetical protein